MADFLYPQRCAVCLAGRCGHDHDEGPGKSGTPAKIAETTVAGTACCADCTVLMFRHGWLTAAPRRIDAGHRVRIAE